MPNKYTQILFSLASAPQHDRPQIDGPICDRLRALSEADIVKADQLKAILDDCAYGSLCSDFAMMAMDTVWRQMLADEKAY